MENEMYHLPQDDFFLIPTAEVPLTGWHQNEILEETSLPRKYTAGTPCFRREAGTYGRENRGLIRLHQFEKVELMQLCTPAQAAIAFAKLLNHAERVLQLLELRYRVVRLAVAELSFASEKTIDLEVWAPASKRWLEVSSVSSFGTFQARRLNLRYRSTADGNVHFLHTLNGSGIALPRTIVALLENCQTDEKTIHVPAVLQPYLGSAVIR
jgi:seryl-tRNA synthetase